MPIADPWMMRGAALVVRTERIRLARRSRRSPRRRPHKLAREAVTVDHRSGGRMGLSMGPAAHPTPSTRIRCARRHAVLAERLEWRPPCGRGKRSRHRGPHFRADPVTFLPNRGSGRHPVWVACTWPHRRPLRRAARQDGVLVARRQPQTARH